MKTFSALIWYLEAMTLVIIFVHSFLGFLVLNIVLNILVRINR